MLVNITDGKVNINVADLAFLVGRRRERFLRFDNALKDVSDFAATLVKNEEEKKGNLYYTDVNLSCSISLNDLQVEINGKASVMEADGNYVIDVVKSMRYPVKLANETFIHSWLCEAKSLAFMLAKKRSLGFVTVRISVFHTETLERKLHEYELSYAELEQSFRATLASFSTYLSIIVPHIKSRNEKAFSAKFPFASVRDGQKDISKEIFSAVKDKRNAIINAPTGLGKTVASMYPSVKAQAKGLCNKIFYLTAKNSGNASVLNALSLFRDAGYDLTVSVITAKSRICDKHNCSPQLCRYPQGHHDRVLGAVFDIATKHKTFTSELITEYATKYSVCPFMLELELVPFADVVVCDYNYVFDPAVSPKLSPNFSCNDVVLIDEAHNLVDRIRNINSAEIEIQKLDELKETLNKNTNLYNTVSSFLRFVKDDVEDGGYSCEPLSSQSLDGLERELNELFSALQEYLEDKDASEDNNAVQLRLLTDSIKMFVGMLTSRSSEYIVFYNDVLNPEIFMVDTSRYIYETSAKIGSFIFFSATLFPEEYYKYMLGARKNDVYLSLPSPFDYKNLLVISCPLSTKYSEREQTIEDVVRAIYSAGRVKCGNYISFFPSYQYMNLAIKTFATLFPDEKVIYQRKQMTDAERASFISSFVENPTSSTYAFAVLGGVFSEGIDLVGEKLSGASVVGLGSLPPSKKMALVSQYFDDMFFDGEKFAYHYPGLNKVFQAGGRVIRSDTDKGFLLIIDDRFLTEDNLENLPSSWQNIKKATDNNTISDCVKNFWENPFKN